VAWFSIYFSLEFIICSYELSLRSLESFKFLISLLEWIAGSFRYTPVALCRCGFVLNIGTLAAQDWGWLADAMCALLWIYGFGGAWHVLCGCFSLICAAVGLLLPPGTKRGMLL
jgi:hypothetical protein